MKRVCVYCGSSPGANPEYASAARRLGSLLAEKGLGLVYGGAHVGIMGEVANAALQEDGQVIGIIPEMFMDKHVHHERLDDLHVVGSMHERKALMSQMSDAFIALPGGIGTLEEFFEALTWAQLGLHHKPCGLLNVAGYFDVLLRFLDHIVAQRLMKQAHRELILVAEQPAELLDLLESYTARPIDKWLDRE